ncbi:MAG: 6,7-dimethyl-8-ribityllumazine synthase [Gammaproteobacteria bacterium]|jgi:6,7-dimethyl-8-ribityllumazine synthase|nr:6,7-dimethyl-8-ribityllumazine synthase [Gammaproteobacteria bacterium]
MAKTVVDTSRLPSIEAPGRIAIVQSKWYPEIVDSMAGVCAAVLAEAGYQRVERHVLPGCLELPLAAKDLLAADTAEDLDAVICFGVIVKGETLHFEMISTECMRGLAAVGLEYRRPVVVEVLPVFDIEHARARAADDEYNKGYEAAAAAIEMIHWRRRNTT